MPSSGGNKPGPTEDNPANLSHVPDWKKRPPSLPRCEDCGSTVGRPGLIHHRPDCPRVVRDQQTDAYMLTETGLDTMWQRASDGHVDEVTLRADVLRMVAEVRRLRVRLIDGTPDA